jgi:hypothetical protein
MKTMNNKRVARRGFTLIELLVRNCHYSNTCGYSVSRVCTG